MVDDNPSAGAERRRVRRVLVALAVLMGLAQPPLLILANRDVPSLAGVPFLAVYLGVAYAVSFALLWRAAR